MKKLFILLLGAAILKSSLAAASQTQLHQPIALINATVIDGTGGPIKERATIVVKNGRITCIGATECDKQTADTHRINMTGKFITPGLVDTHVHFSQTGWFDGRPDSLKLNPIYSYSKVIAELKANPERWHRSYLCSGITAVYDVGGPAFTLDLQSQGEKNTMAVHVRAAGPAITHASSNSPGLRMNMIEGSPTFFPMGSEAETRDSIRRLHKQGTRTVKVLYSRPPKGRQADYDARLIAAGDEAKSLGLDLIVHATGLREAKVALKAGAKMLVHSVENQDVDEEFISLAKINNTIYSPTILVTSNWQKGLANIALGTKSRIDDPNHCVDNLLRARIQNDLDRLKPYLPTGFNEARAHRIPARIANQERRKLRNLSIVHRAGITIATATDAGNPLTLHGPSIYSEMEAMQAAGLKPSEIIVMSTKNGAQAMGRLDDFGTLEIGKLANLVVLENNPMDDISNYRSITNVMRMGVLHRISDLNYDKN